MTRRNKTMNRLNKDELKAMSIDELTQLKTEVERLQKEEELTVQHKTETLKLIRESVSNAVTEFISKKVDNVYVLTYIYDTLYNDYSVCCNIATSKNLNHQIDIHIYKDFIMIDHLSLSDIANTKSDDVKLLSIANYLLENEKAFLYQVFSRIDEADVNAYFNAKYELSKTIDNAYNIEREIGWQKYMQQINDAKAKLKTAKYLSQKFVDDMQDDIIEKVTDKTVTVSEIWFDGHYKDGFTKTYRHRYSIDDVARWIVDNNVKIVDNFDEKIAKAREEYEQRLEFVRENRGI